MGTRRLLAILGIVAVLGAACGGDAESEEPEDTGSATQEEEPVQAEESVSIGAADFQFDPDTITVAAGGTVEVTNEGDAKHNFSAQDAGIDEDVDVGGSTTVDLADVEPGTYDFICKYHADSMTGTLEIVE